MILFDELLDTLDFKAKAEKLAADFREKNGLGRIHQLGLVVPDVEAAALALESRGLGPFFIASGAPVLWREKGRDLSFKGKLGMAMHRGFELELLEPGAGSSFYGDCVDRAGKIVVQHLGLLVEEVDEWSGRLSGQGCPVRVRGRIKTGPLTTDFAYMDTMEEAGLVIEFISWKVLGRGFTPPGGLYHALGKVQKLTGWRSLST